MKDGWSVQNLKWVLCERSRLTEIGCCLNPEYRKTTSPEMMERAKGSSVSVAWTSGKGKHKSNLNIQLTEAMNDKIRMDNNIVIKTYGDSQATTPSFHRLEYHVSRFFSMCKMKVVLLVDESTFRGGMSEQQHTLQFDELDIRVRDVVHLLSLGYKLVREAPRGL